MSAGNAKSKVSKSNTSKQTMSSEDLTVKNIRGKIVQLSPREVFFRLESGSFEINRMIGEVAKKVPQTINDFDAGCLLRGIRAGRIFLGSKELTQEPTIINQTEPLSERHVAARRLLDITDPGEFEVAISRGYGLHVIEACLEIEKREGNRHKFVSIINNRLSKAG